MNAQNASSISQATTDDQIAEFWDTHSTAEFWDQTHEVDIIFDPSARLYVVIEPELLADIRRIAREHHVSTQTLINLWLRQKAHQVLLSQK